MIRITSSGLHVSVGGPVVYLDNWAIYDLAENDLERRWRFLEAVHSGIDLLFSVTNAAELSGPHGRSAEVVREFLDAIGPHWFPAPLDATAVVKREMAGERPELACIDQNFFKSYVARQMRPYVSDPAKLVEVSDRLFRLGPVLDWVGPQRESISEGSAEFDAMIKGRMLVVREMSRRDRESFDRRFPARPLDSRRRAGFVYANLLRIMALDADSLKKGDGLDFCHTVVGFAYASFAALDKHWKRRVANLPPNPLARVYSAGELDQMVTDMESWHGSGGARDPAAKIEVRSVGGIHGNFQTR